MRQDQFNVAHYRARRYLGAGDTPTIRYRQSGSDVSKGTMALVFCVLVGVLFFQLFGGYYY
jgi:hypothetical protein